MTGRQGRVAPGADGGPGTGPRRRHTGVPGAVWQVEVRTRLDELHQQLDSLGPGDPPLAAALRERLAGVEPVLGRAGVLGWLRGGDVEYAWQTLHAVERAMVGLRPVAEIVGFLPAYRDAAARFLRADDKVVTDIDPAADAATPALLRAKVQALLLRYHCASDEFHEAVRRLRNRMLGLSVSALVAEALLVLVQWRNPDVPLVRVPADAVGVPPWRLLLVVLLAGALGAFVSALPSMITSQSAGLPYRLPFQQGLLKLAVGPLVAVVGIMLVVGGLANTTVNSTAALLGLAIVFGAGQQAVTAFADRRAADLLAPVTRGRGARPG
ncbi:hypothetical protein O7598_13195 [Micromonospora sp. WMMC241]|uniref:hypothetical protein n=1 Tax=Micromonospora sp. WMMC241 TaxID=3015159 RepID=UPI0022B700A6|nr:hypothetical protein [Micromonospora sp. WMMC241]MCZ7437355.1 hypothetical protein [Micromonospora sp. WMMC241]